MKLPDGWEKFYQDVFNKTSVLAKTHVWNTDHASMLAWLGNFQEDEHRYIAAHILDRLTYRTDRMTESNYSRFLSSTFRSYVESIQGITEVNVKHWLSGLGNTSNSWMKNIRICSVTKAGEHGESGGHIIRLLTGKLFSEKSIFPVDTTKLSDLDGKIILIVDDFIGSGTQFDKFAKASDLKAAARKNRIIYAPAMAYDIGIQNIQNASYGLELRPLEIVTQDERFFSHVSGAKFCGDDVNSEADVMKCYEEMRGLCKSFGPGAWLGRDNVSLCVGFQWGCPNQTLGILWYEGDEGWNQLLRRRGSQ